MVTWLEQQLLDALKRLERAYCARDAAILQRLQAVTQDVNTFSAQVEDLTQTVQRLIALAESNR
jgi:hypothetical protein